MLGESMYSRGIFTEKIKHQSDRWIQILPKVRIQHKLVFRKGVVGSKRGFKDLMQIWAGVRTKSLGYASRGRFSTKVQYLVLHN